MTRAQPPCPTAEDALCQAMVRAVETLTEPGLLTGASFGRFTNPAEGWHWELELSRRITSDHPHLKREPDRLDHRTRIIITAWQRDVARYQRDFTPAGEKQ